MRRVLGLSIILPLCGSAFAQTEEAGGGRLQRSEHRGLWPFYSRDVFDDGSTRFSSLFGAVGGEFHSNGDYHHRVLPFYATTLTGDGSDHRLALYPLLYLRRRSPEVSYDIALPFGASWAAGSARHHVLWPFLHLAENPEEAAYRYIPVLYRHGVREGFAEHRLGALLLFELFGYAREEEEEVFAAGTFFPLFSKPGKAPLSLGRLSSEPDSWRAHVFPLFFAGRDDGATADWYLYSLPLSLWADAEERGVALPVLLSWWYATGEGYDLHALWPLVRVARRAHWSTTRFLPFYLAAEDRETSRSYRFFSIFYGWVEHADRNRVDHHVPLLLSHYGHEPGETALDVLWPLGHYWRRGDDFTIRALPFFDRSRHGQSEVLGIGTFLYRHYWNPTRTIAWLFPAYFHSRMEDEQRRWTTTVVLPSLITHSEEALTDGEWVEVKRWFHLFPFFDHSRDTQSEALGIGAFLYRRHESLTGTVTWLFPAYFHSRAEEERSRSATTVILPSLFTHAEEALATNGDWVEVERWLHLWPFFGYRMENDHARGSTGEDSPDLLWPILNVREVTYSTLYPLFQLTRTTDEQGDLLETEIDAPLPFVRLRTDAESFDFEMLPLAFIGDRPRRTYLYLYPLLSVEAGTKADSNLASATSLVQWYDDREERHFRLFPLIFTWKETPSSLQVSGPLWWFHYESSPDGGWFHLLPLGFGSWEGDDVSLGVFPFFFQRDHGSDPVNYGEVGRFFFLWNSLHNESESHHSLLWKVMEYSENNRGDHEFRLLHRLVVDRRVKGQRELVVNPLFDTFSDAQTGRSSMSVLKFLYRQEVEDGIETHYVFFIPVWSSPAPPPAPR